jgi:hypothetical protein
MSKLRFIITAIAALLAGYLGGTILRPAPLAAVPSMPSKPPAWERGSRSRSAGILAWPETRRLRSKWAASSLLDGNREDGPT